MQKTKFLIATCFMLAAVPAVAQSNSANEGSAATPDGTYARPMTSPPVQTQDQDQDQQHAQRQANSDPYNMPRTYSAQPSDPQSQQDEEASGNGQAPSDADSGTSADRTNPAASPD
jgi:hypothetical protein